MKMLHGGQAEAEPQKQPENREIHQPEAGTAAGALHRAPGATSPSRGSSLKMASNIRPQIAATHEECAPDATNHQMNVA